ncbi:hypothetical protein FHX74_000746 [Friedmanniella endophytica]|uniref:Uncharacterized protein n=1 Tax=Microlunatus kandeliicorticis TaxID=1759536 RepID=A0A7W3P4S9_9ACTN|nr:hypothetical protein [Microlunatus kandeliicorticis]MBA8793152.1 hypothetical protein [Microlunatus kandeliicorticis]
MPKRPPQPARRGGAPQDPKAALAKEGRLWLLALVCAAAGAATVAGTGKLLPGIGVFLLCLVVLGPLLYWFEKWRQRRGGSR